jgi:hypothetical protein
MPLLIRKHLFHIERRDGAEDGLGVHELLRGEHFAEVGGVNPRGLLEVVVRVFVFAVGHDFGELDVVAVGVLCGGLVGALGARGARGIETGDLALRVLGRMAGCDWVLLKLGCSFRWALDGLRVVVHGSLRRLGCVDRRHAD